MSVTSLVHPSVCLCPGWHIHAELVLPSSCLSLPHVPSLVRPSVPTCPCSPSLHCHTPGITCCHPGDGDTLMQWPCSYIGSEGTSLPRELWSGQALAVPPSDSGDEVTRVSLSLPQVLRVWGLPVPPVLREGWAPVLQEGLLGTLWGAVPRLLRADHQGAGHGEHHGVPRGRTQSLVPCLSSWGAGEVGKECRPPAPLDVSGVSFMF